jgi:hypothetical protein
VATTVVVITVVDAGVKVMVVLMDLADLVVGATAQVVLAVEHLVVLVVLAVALATVFNPFVKKSVNLFENSKELSIFADKYRHFISKT